MLRLVLFMVAFAAMFFVWPFVLVGFCVWFAWRVAGHFTRKP